MFAKLNLLFFLDTISGFHFTCNGRGRNLPPSELTAMPDENELRPFTSHSIFLHSLA